jgi:hypothetical protein
MLFAHHDLEQQLATNKHQWLLQHQQHHHEGQQPAANEHWYQHTQQNNM